MTYQPKLGFWLTEASAPAAEIVAGLGYDFVVLDAEHGRFGDDTLESYIPLLKGLGLDVLTKVLGPVREPMQRALDFGSDGIIIPHVTDVEHARAVTAFTKYPPRGERSVAGGRLFGYRGAFTDDDLAAIDRRQLVLPLVEDPRAVRDIEQILALDTVDGFQMGPGDNSLMSGRGVNKGTDADWADIERCAAAGVASGKTWLYPAWTPRDQEWALARKAPLIMIGIHFHVLEAGIRALRDDFAVLRDKVAESG